MSKKVELANVVTTFTLGDVPEYRISGDCVASRDAAYNIVSTEKCNVISRVVAIEYGVGYIICESCGDVLINDNLVICEI